MRVDLNLPADKAQDFLLYFTAEAKRNSNGLFPYGDSQAGFEVDGSYVARLSGRVRDGENIVHVHWTIPQMADGAIPYIEYEILEGDRAAQVVSGYLYKVLAAALSERKESYFQRVYFTHVGPMLDGEYWLPGYRLAPAFVEEPDDQYLIDAERVNCIDQQIYAVDTDHARQIAEYQAELLITRLALLTRVGFYKHYRGESVWVHTRGENNQIESQRLRRGYKLDSLPKSMPKKGALCWLGAFGASITEEVQYAGHLITLPKETRVVFRALNESVSFQRPFDSCAKLFQLSIIFSQYSASAALAYKVAAVDALAQQTAYKNFSKFMRAQLPGEEGLDDFLDLLYRDVRSAHFHGGAKPLDLAPAFMGDMLDRGRHQNFLVQLHSGSLLWKAISKWILSESTRNEKSNPQK